MAHIEHKRCYLDVQRNIGYFFFILKVTTSKILNENTEFQNIKDKYKENTNLCNRKQTTKETRSIKNHKE